MSSLGRGGANSGGEKAARLDDIGLAQRDVIQRCIRAGLDVTVLASTLHSREYMCLLLRPRAQRMEIENNRLTIERWLQIGAVGQVPSEIEQLFQDGIAPATASIFKPSSKIDKTLDELQHDDSKTNATHAVPSTSSCFLTPAERLQTIGRIITSTTDESALNPPGAGISMHAAQINNDLKINSQPPSIVAKCFPLHNRTVRTYVIER